MLYSFLASARMRCSRLKGVIDKNDSSIENYFICGDEETVFHYVY